MGMAAVVDRFFGGARYQRSAETETKKYEHRKKYIFR